MDVNLKDLIVLLEYTKSKINWKAKQLMYVDSEVLSEMYTRDVALYQKAITRLEDQVQHSSSDIDIKDLITVVNCANKELSIKRLSLENKHYSSSYNADLIESKIVREISTFQPIVERLMCQINLATIHVKLC